MSLCSLNMNMHEQAFYDLLQCQQSSIGADLPSLLTIKIKYRLALILAYLRDFYGSAQILKDLKKYCNVYE